MGLREVPKLCSVNAAAGNSDVCVVGLHDEGKKSEREINYGCG